MKDDSLLTILLKAAASMPLAAQLAMLDDLTRIRPRGDAFWRRLEAWALQLLAAWRVGLLDAEAGARVLAQVPLRSVGDALGTPADDLAAFSVDEPAALAIDEPAALKVADVVPFEFSPVLDHPIKAMPGIRFKETAPRIELGVGGSTEGAAPRSGPPAAPPSAPAPDAMFEALPEAEPQQAFHFVLHGEQARGAALRVDSSATLSFNYAVPPADALATVAHAALDAARHADVDITLQATARGGLSISGERVGVARFRGGVMAAPVNFELTAGASSDAPGQPTSGVHVDFLVKGESVHQLELTILVVASAAELDALPTTAAPANQVPLALLGDALSAPPPPEHRLHVSLSFDGGDFCIELRHLKDGEVESEDRFVSDGIDRGKLEALVTGVRDELELCYESKIWRTFDGRLPTPPAGALPVALQRTLACVAAAGARLNDSLREDDALAQALDYIEASLPPDSVITIATDDVFLPWEILYPREWSSGWTDEQKAAHPLEPAAFWGARYAIETVQRGTGSLGGLRKLQLECSPKVSVNLNPTIDIDGVEAADKPIAVQQAWAARLGEQGRLDGIQDECKAMRQVLQNAANDATLIYIYCHGNAANPFGGKDELLQLAEGCGLKPRDLQGDTAYRAAPIVFLNACQSGAHSPMAFSTFLKEFRRRGALGMIATSYAIPIVFGAHFGAEVVDGYLRRSGSLAVVMQGLRRRHLLERGNPVPLFYSLQCQLSFPPVRAAGGR